MKYRIAVITLGLLLLSLLAVGLTRGQDRKLLLGSGGPVSSGGGGGGVVTLISTQTTYVAATTSPTLAATCTGGDYMLIVAGNSTGSTISGDADAVNYGGENATAVFNVVEPASARLVAYEILTPASSGTVTVNWTGSTWTQIAAHCFSGVNQTTPTVGAVSTNTSTSGSVATVATASSDATDFIYAAIFRWNADGPASFGPTSGTGGTEVFETSDDVGMAGQSKPGTGSAVTASWTWSDHPVGTVAGIVRIQAEPAPSGGINLVSTQSNYTAGSAAPTLSATCTGGDYMLIVAGNDTGATISGDADAINYGGENATAVFNVGAGGDARLVAYEILTPASSGTVTVNWTGSTGSWVAAHCFSGANQTTPSTGAVTTSSGTSGSVVTVATAGSASTDIVIAAVVRWNADAPASFGVTSGSGGTELYELSDSVGIAGQSKPGTGSAVTASWTWSDHPVGTYAGIVRVQD